MNEMRTFAEWSNAGYKILKGSTGTRVDGKILFSKKQVQFLGTDRDMEWEIEQGALWDEGQGGY